MAPGEGRKPGFSLVELVVVIVIIGILAAIAIPRLSRGASGAGQSALQANLATIRNALNMYAAEHKSAFPTVDANGALPQLTLYTDIEGNTNASKTTTYKYGPYLLTIPPVPCGPNAGKTTASKILKSATSPPTPDPSGGEGWVYNETTGEFRANTKDVDVDDSGNPYNKY